MVSILNSFSLFVVRYRSCPLVNELDVRLPSSASAGVKICLANLAKDQNFL